MTEPTQQSFSLILTITAGEPWENKFEVAREIERIGLNYREE